jgi:hypothetical protein
MIRNVSLKTFFKKLSTQLLQLEKSMIHSRLWFVIEKDFLTVCFNVHEWIIGDCRGATKKCPLMYEWHGKEYLGGGTHTHL